jgi:hypothetical protein
MATTYKTAAVNSGLKPDFGTPAGMVISRSVKHTLTKNMGSLDILQLIPIPKGAQIIDLIFVASCTSECTMDVGDAASTARFLKSITSVKAHQLHRPNADAGMAGFMFQYTEDDTIDLKILTSSMDSASAVGLTVLYKMAGSISDESF